MSPLGLNPGERRFVEDLKRYWADIQDDGIEVFLLRNQGRGVGVGFFENSGFYPDFILWIKRGDRQRVVFIDPHGMIHEKSYQHDEKARLHERLPELAREISKRSQVSDISLDSFIISETTYENLHKRYGDGNWSLEDFSDKHILFPIRNASYDYIERIFSTPK